jgi:hypothetical protein
MELAVRCAVQGRAGHDVTDRTNDPGRCKQEPVQLTIERNQNRIRKKKKYGKDIK